MGIIFFIVVLAISIAIQILMQPKPPSSSPSNYNENDIPSAGMGNAIPVIFGTVKIGGQNCIYAGNFSSRPIKEGGGKGKGGEVVVGYRYYFTYQFVICIGRVDDLLKIEQEGKTLFDKDEDSYSDSDTNFRFIDVFKPTLYGDEDKEGGFAADIKFYWGKTTQQPDTHIENIVGVNELPAYINRTTVVYSGRWGATLGAYVGNQARVRADKFTVKRTQQGILGETMWNIADAEINGDMNPAHILRELLTSELGSNLNPNNLDDDSFHDFADQMISENFGLSFLWNTSSKIEDFAADIMRHVNGFLVSDRQTGKLRIKLIRNDYDEEELLHLTEDNILRLDNFENVTEELIENFVTVKYTDKNFDDQVAETHAMDLGLIARHGSLRKKELEFKGINNETLAQEVSHRELAIITNLLIKFEVVCDKSAFMLNIGDPFKVTFGPDDVNGMIMRVSEINLGKTGDDHIKIKAVQDIFKTMPSTVASTAGQNKWTSPTNVLENLDTIIARELLYAEIVAADALEDITESDSRIIFNADKKHSDYRSYQIFDKLSSGSYENISTTGQFSIFAALVSNIDNNQTEITIKNYPSVEDLTDSASKTGDGIIAQIGDELISITEVAFNETQTQAVLTIMRGVYDSIPSSHLANDRMVLSSSGNIGYSRLYSKDSTVNYKLSPQNGLGSLSIDDTTQYEYEIKARHNNPYPPANVKINDEYFPSSVGGSIVLTWSTRNRITQGDQAISWYDENVSSEIGVKYIITFYDDDEEDEILSTELSSNTYTAHNEILQAYFDPETSADITVEIKSVRDDEESFYAYRHTVTWSDDGSLLAKIDFHLFDIPAISNNNLEGGLVALVIPKDENFTSCKIELGVDPVELDEDGEEAEQINEFEFETLIESNTTTGAKTTLTASLGSFDNFNVIDSVNTITVNETDGYTFEQLTNDDFDNLQALCLIGNELIAWRDVVDNEDGTFTLSHLARGLFNTDAEIQSYSTGENVYLLTPGSFIELPIDGEYTGSDIIIRVSVDGQDPVDGEEFEHTFNNLHRRPYNPISLSVARNESNDLTLSWIRRARGVNKIFGETLPVHSEPETYEIDIYKNNSLVRTEIVEEQTEFLYDTVFQFLDRVSAGNTVKFEVFQIDEFYGRGLMTSIEEVL